MTSILSAMLNGTMVGALVAAGVWVGLRVAPRRVLNAAARYLVWWTALAAVVLLPLAYLRVPQASRASGAPVRFAETAAPQVYDRAVAPEPAGGDVVPPPKVPARSSGLSFPLVVTAGPWLQWILTVWVGLSASMLLRLAVSCILLERRKRRAFAAPPQLTARIETWLGRQVRLACSAEIETPMLAGLRKPAILLPARLIEELQDEELHQIGLHEAAHLARHDDYALLIQRAIEAVFALHPVVRWITRQIDLEREIACDDAVVETTGRPRSYAECLTRMVELCGGVRASWAGAAAADDRSQLAKRVDRLLDQNRQAGTRYGRRRLATAVLLVGALACVVARTPGAIAFAMPADRTAALSVSTEAGGQVEPPAQPAEPSVAPEEPAPPSPQQPAQPTVRIAVTVQDPLNRYVTGLGKEIFRVFEDGVEQEVSEFSSAHAPLSAGIVLDASGSMGGKLEAPRLAVEQFLNAPNPQDEFFLVTFNDEPELAAGFTSDTGLILNQLNRVRARGGTGLRDAINRALGEMRNARNPDRVLLVVSDGNDNSSSLSQEGLRSAVRAADVQIYAITFAEPDGSGVSGIRGQAVMREIAELSGGQQFLVDDLAKAPGAAAGVAVRNVYRLGYKPKNAARDGKFRYVGVEANPPRGIPPLRVSLRTGYYAPAQ